MINFAASIGHLNISRNFHGTFDGRRQTPNLGSIDSDLVIESRGLCEVHMPHLKSVRGDIIIKDVKLQVLNLTILEEVRGSMEISTTDLEALAMPLLRKVGFYHERDYDGGSLVLGNNRFLKTVDMPSLKVIGRNKVCSTVCCSLDDQAKIVHMRHNRFEISGSSKLEVLHLPLLNNVAGHMEIHDNAKLQVVNAPNVEIIGGNLDLTLNDDNSHDNNGKLHTLEMSGLEVVCHTINVRHTALGRLRLPYLRHPVRHIYVHCNSDLKWFDMNQVPDVLGNLEIINNGKLKSKRFLMQAVNSVEGHLVYFKHKKKFQCKKPSSSNPRRSLSVPDHTPMSSKPFSASAPISSTSSLGSIADSTPSTVRSLSATNSTVATRSTLIIFISVQKNKIVGYTISSHMILMNNFVWFWRCAEHMFRQLRYHSTR